MRDHYGNSIVAIIQWRLLYANVFQYHLVTEKGVLSYCVDLTAQQARDFAEHNGIRVIKHLDEV